MKKLPLVFLCSISVGGLLLSAFGESNADKTTTSSISETTSSPSATPQVLAPQEVSTQLPGNANPALLEHTQNINEGNTGTSAEAIPTEESKVWCDRHPERCKHIHERQAKKEAERIEKLQSLCEKNPDDKQCLALKEMPNLADKQGEASNASLSSQNQLEKHLEENR